MMNITPVVKQLLILNIIFYIGSQIVGESAYHLFSLYYFENPSFQFWQPLTHMFMHAAFPDLSHILFNMFALYSFGSTLEHFWGGKRFLVFYLICGFGAAFVHLGASYYHFHEGLNVLLQNHYSQVDVMNTLNKGMIDTKWQSLMTTTEFSNFTESYLGTAVGASGAIYGLLVAFAFMFPNAELSLMFIPVPIKAKYFVPLFMLIYDGFFGIFGNSFLGIGAGVAHYAHIGGALTGFIIMMLWRNKKFQVNRLN